MVRTGTPLAQLADFAGVATSYVDVFDEQHVASEETVRALLTSLGFDVSTGDATQRALAECDRRTYVRGLQPVYVVSVGDAVRLQLYVPGPVTSKGFQWSLTGEDGVVVRRAHAAPSKLLGVTHFEGQTYERRLLRLGSMLAEGYYALWVSDGAREYRSTLIVAPPSCYVPEAFLERGIWGLAAQVYALRSQRDWGAGDFTDLRTLCSIVRDAGGGAVAVNPLHLLPRGGSSPYAPSSRTYVNWAFLDVTALPGHSAGDIPRDDLARLRANELIDYPLLYETKARAARAAFDRFRTAPAHAADTSAFAAFVRDGGDALRSAAIFEALAERFRPAGGVVDWRTWPEAYRHARSSEVEAFAAEHAEDVAFYSYLQWQADAQLQRVADECREMPVGLYRDLAVGTQLGGVDTWLGAGTLLHDVAAGAPPDLLNREGQNWGVAPFDPLALREAAYAPFAKLVRANARHAGALRIDHVMGLLRLWWVPAGFAASQGAYVGYRLGELLGVLALESRRAKCLVIGEDLGTVPPGFRERLEAARVLSYRVLQFERDDERFLPPDAYPRLALAATGTHDLPTMAAYWCGSDIDVRAQAGVLASEAVAREREDRKRARALLARAFEAAGIVVDDERIGLVANEFLARTPALLLIVALEDVLGELDQINLPTTVDEHPNWRRRNSLALEALDSDPRFRALAQALRSRGAR